ncbi:ribonuclease HII [Paenibacillus assamensis]|uniref:ribonuclease HII n=1 Tax=Paenibacillus assamensis TaxID=311244 RepID=UPI0004200531|nr:ribonuclease HII [Paenibacillus assamensis]
MGAKRSSASEAEVIDLLALEREAWSAGYEAIAGIDEVGRGCLFGDVVAAAVILPRDWQLEGINDSKKLSEKKREALYEDIIANAVAWSVAHMDAKAIDELNIKQATRLAMKIAVEQLKIAPDMLFIDAEKIQVELPQKSLIKGDATSQSIAAASIIAKVTRDRLCSKEWNELYPEYGIAVHKGYGTKAHYAALDEYGPTKMHRRTFLKKWEETKTQLTLF